MRPVILRIAVGPANSDDIKVVQALTQAFTPGSTAKSGCGPIQTDGVGRERRALGRRQGRSRHHPRRSRRAEERTGRGDAAQERRGAVGAAGHKGQRQEGRQRRSPKSRSLPATASASSAAPQANVNLLKVILQAIRRRSGQGRDRSISGQRGGGRHPQPEGRRLSRRRTRQQQDHDGCDRGIDARRRHADLPGDRFRRGDRAKPSSV